MLIINYDNHLPTSYLDLFYEERLHHSNYVNFYYPQKSMLFTINFSDIHQSIYEQHDNIMSLCQHRFTKLSINIQCFIKHVKSAALINFNSPQLTLLQFVNTQKLDNNFLLLPLTQSQMQHSLTKNLATRQIRMIDNKSEENNHESDDEASYQNNSEYQKQKQVKHEMLECFQNQNFGKSKQGKEKKKKITLSNMVKINGDAGNNLRQKIQNQGNQLNQFITTFTDYTHNRLNKQSLEKYNSKPKNFRFSKKYEHRNPQIYFISIISHMNHRNSIIIRQQKSMCNYSTYINQTQIQQKIKEFIKRIAKGSLLIIFHQKKEAQNEKILKQLQNILLKEKYQYIEGVYDFDRINKEEFKIKIISAVIRQQRQINAEQQIQKWKHIMIQQQQLLKTVRGQKLQNEVIVGFDCMLLYLYYRENIPLKCLKQKVIQFAQIRRDKIKMSLTTNQEDFKHIPTKMERCKNCKVCKSEQKRGKSIYKCQGCSLLYNIDITLCINKTQTNCFRRFHQDEARYAKHMKINRRLIPLPNNDDEERISQIKPQLKNEEESQIDRNNRIHLTNMTHCVKLFDDMMERNLKKKNFELCKFMINSMASSANLMMARFYPQSFQPINFSQLNPKPIIQEEGEKESE